MFEKSPAESNSTVVNSRKFNFFYSFRPIYYFARTFGFMPFTLVFNSNGSIQGPNVRIFDILWFIIAIAIYILSAIVVLQNTELAEIGSNIESAILKNTDFVLLVFMLFFGALIIVMDMYNRFKIFTIIKSINTFDEEVCTIGDFFWCISFLISNNVYSLMIIEHRWRKFQFISIIIKSTVVLGYFVQRSTVSHWFY